MFLVQYNSSFLFHILFRMILQRDKSESAERIDRGGMLIIFP